MFMYVYNVGGPLADSLTRVLQAHAVFRSDMGYVQVDI